MPAWLLTRPLDRSAQIRLVCVPNAGAGALTFREWPKALHGVDVAIAHLPGRDGRRSEPPPQDIVGVAAAVAGALDALPALPTAVFGHSMGALIAFEIARALEQAGRPVAGLIASARRAPSLPSRFTDVSAIASDVAFLEALEALYGGVPDVVWDDEELRALWVPTIRADMAMVHRYRRAPGPVLSCPIWVYSGRDDERVSADELDGWRSETTGPFAVRSFAGGHFFIDSAKADVIGSVAADLASLVRP